MNKSRTFALSYGELTATLVDLLATGRRKSDEPVMFDGGWMVRIVDRRTGEVLAEGTVDVTDIDARKYRDNKGLR